MLIVSGLTRLPSPQRPPPPEAFSGTVDMLVEAGYW